ncbi:probable calcium-binding protein CML25 [Cucurbita pepo subsp. pepo]|uniref:probable calcium-binding protein CML25 n=1 Tax=Cucurbita pepo subsp. pepo TaxID=3664 RepID=UPI000C9D8C3D|nr:probable calcium-binding protein CML25 [Cucurbita pepo subsp. pepo]
MGFKSLFCRKKKPFASVDSPLVSASTTLGSGSSLEDSRAQIAELEEVFKKFDVNGDGKISSSELGTILGSLGHNAKEEELAKMIEEFDADGDGFIDLQEFVELNTKEIDPEELLESLREAFSVYDIDGNGSITAEELHEVLKSLGDDCSVEDCRQMISGVDRNGDGMISFEEFKVMMMSTGLSVADG